MKKLFWLMPLLAVVVFSCKKSEIITEPTEPTKVKTKSGLLQRTATDDEINLIAESTEFTNWVSLHQTEAELLQGDTTLEEFMNSEAFAENLESHQSSYNNFTEDQRQLLEIYLEIHETSAALKEAFPGITSFDDEDLIKLLDIHFEIDESASCIGQRNKAINRCFQDFLIAEFWTMIGGTASPGASIAAHLYNVQVHLTCNKRAESDYQECIRG